MTRDKNGTLRHASWDERDRWTQIFIPAHGRKLFPPKMFEEQQLEVRKFLVTCVYLVSSDNSSSQVNIPAYFFCGKSGQNSVKIGSKTTKIC